MAQTTSSVASGSWRFHVSDVVRVPLRGYLLRLRLVQGDPELSALEPGKTIRLVGPDGAERTATVKALSVTQGRPSQARMEKKRELDLVVPPADVEGSPPVEMGWSVVGR